MLPFPEDEGAFAVGKGSSNQDPGEAHSRGEERDGGPSVKSEQGGPHRVDLVTVGGRENLRDLGQTTH